MSRYTPLIKLATGGTATVYAGLDRLTGELVALKRPHEHLVAEPSFLRSLRAEVSIASRITHPNVVSIRGVEPSGEVSYLVMDYVRGASLVEMLTAASRQRIAPEVALRIAADACAGLHAAHELRGDDGQLLGVVHRDVSPHNLMVGVDGVTRVADFGIAKCVDAQFEKTTTAGVLKGKFAYMAPEYIRGESLDRRADIFGLGVVLWETLAGTRLFKGANPIESGHNVLQRPVPSLASIAPGLGRFDAVVAMALAKDPRVRVPTARAWQSALEALPIASHAEVAAVLDALLGKALTERQGLIDERLNAMAEVTGATSQRTDDTLPLPVPFDLEDELPTLVLPTTLDDSDVVEASQQQTFEPTTIPEPQRAIPHPEPAPPLAPPRRAASWLPWSLGIGASLAVLGALAALASRTVVAPPASPIAPPAAPPSLVVSAPPQATPPLVPAATSVPPPVDSTPPHGPIPQPTAHPIASTTTPAPRHSVDVAPPPSASAPSPITTLAPWPSAAPSASSRRRNPYDDAGP